MYCGAADVWTPFNDRFGAGLALLGLETPAAAQLAAALKSKRTDKRLDLELDNSLSWTEFKRGHQLPVETRKMKQGGQPSGSPGRG